MLTEAHRKVNAEHLRRDAFLYVRQSTLRQVLENTESTQRQYALRDRAVALGWPIERIHTLDEDLGCSGAQAKSRDGFQRLVSEVALGRAGIVLGLEVSRLARNNADWQRLLELCALSRCLICDEDGVYDPAHFNDRLLLGLKGTISAAELHILKARLIGGQRNKARRGALELPLPIGLSYNAAKAVTLDPDTRIQASLRLIFDAFSQTRSVAAVMDRFRRGGLTFPRRVPHALVGHTVWARYSAATVEVFFRSARVASHVRSYQRGKHTTLPEHMPKSHRAHAEWTPKRLIQWGESIGVNAGTIVEHLLRSKPHPEQGYRACLGLLALSREYGEQRLEAASVMALRLGSPTRKSVKSILESGRDLRPISATDTLPLELPMHGNVRGPGYYH